MTTTTELDIAAVQQVMRSFDTPGDPDWCGWILAANTEDAGAALIVCDVDRDWARTMPGDATRHGMAMALQRYSDALTGAGFVTVYWTPPGLHARGLIVAADQAAADHAAPAMCAALDRLNPPRRTP